ncbi:helix-turn-helix domain-containing protein [Microbacterium sp. Bi121]|uniref:helix-turn-helix domain-containing protein n=1 Tax=Microbacterium sp. Bi121 TaxID=2822348 RepID=UPI001DAA5A13|nr:helix-turn-helix domain-containing protein [Microbacterium sp. Bi121]CAH0207386.1 hypothetical protein SRABI121_02638 [Microbacterium sp. Bi121]
MSIPVPAWYPADAIKRYGLVPSEQAVYDCLCYHAHARTRIAWPSQGTIGEERNLNPRTVKRAMARLAEVGLIVQQEAGRRGRSARWLIVEIHPRGTSKLGMPNRRAEWSSDANGLVRIDPSETGSHDSWGSTSVAGPEVGPRNGGKSALGITGQNGSTSASGPPEDNGARSAEVSPVIETGNAHRSAASASDSKAEDDVEEPDRSSLISSSAQRGNHVSQRWDDCDEIQSEAIERSRAEGVHSAPQAQDQPQAPSEAQLQALADLARMITDVEITVIDSHDADALIKELRGEQYRRIHNDEPFDCALDDLSAGAQRYFHERHLDHLFGEVNA